MNIFFVVPGNPLPKERPRVMKGWTYTPQRTIDAEKKIGLLAQQAMKGRKPTTKNVRVRMEFYRKTKIRVDYDNLAKLVGDAMNGRVYQDDGQIVEAVIVKWYDRKNPRTVIEVEEVL